MGLLDTIIDSAKRGAGLLAPTQEDVNFRANMPGLIADFTPIVGDAKSVYDGVQSARQGDYLGAGLGALGALPFVPAMGGILKGNDLKAEVLRQAKEGWGKAIGETGEFTLKKMYPVTLDINGKKMQFGASKASGAGPLSLTRLADTQYGPKFVHYKLSKDGDLIQSGQQNLFAMSPDVRDEHVSYFKKMFDE